MKRLLKKLMVEESGQDLIEYALLAGFISLVAVGAITTVGTGVNDIYAEIALLDPLAPSQTGAEQGGVSHPALPTAFLPSVHLVDLVAGRSQPSVARLPRCFA